MYNDDNWLTCLECLAKTLTMLSKTIYLVFVLQFWSNIRKCLLVKLDFFEDIRVAFCFSKLEFTVL